MSPTKKKPSPDTPLTPKQERFCREYLVDLNGAQAAVRAGYSERASRTIAAENLTKPNIKKRIAELQSARSARTEITADMVVRELAAIGFADIRECFNKNGDLVNPNMISDGIARAVAGVDVIEIKKGVRIKKLKMWNKVSALETLGKHLGIFEQDNGNATAINVNVIKTAPPPGGGNADS